MYRNYYRFKKYPFCNTPDTDFFFQSEKHQEALASLYYVISERKGFAVILGDVGTGKTIVSRALLNKTPPGTEVGLITNTCLKEDDFLKAICEEFHLQTEGLSPGQLLSSLNDFFLQMLSQDKNVVLLVDEAQNLSQETLDKIRMLSNLETETEKLVQIVLVGQPELKEKICQGQFQQLKQRIHLWYYLFSLDIGETKRYIQHRLKVAGNSLENLFAEDALEAIFHYSGGIPRVINALCDHALLLGYIRELSSLSKKEIKEVAQDLCLRVPKDFSFKKPEEAESVLERFSKAFLWVKQSKNFQRNASLAAVLGGILAVTVWGLQREKVLPPPVTPSLPSLVSQDKIWDHLKGSPFLPQLKEVKKIASNLQSLIASLQEEDIKQSHAKLPSEIRSIAHLKLSPTLNFISTESEF